MMSFEAGDIIVVDYPHVETNILKRRPALVISKRSLGPDGLVLWAAMITNAANRGWPGDIAITDYRAVGLPIPSVVRTEKIAMVECRGAERLSHVTPQLLAQVQSSVADYLGLPSPR
jgi:mRNA interferase MazF